MSTQRPNILILIPHDLGDFLGCHGHASVSSPHLDRLAAEGVRFSSCFATSPECTPSRGGLMTGLHPHQNGLMGLSNFGWSLRVPHLAERLRDHGYATHHFGFQHETHGPAQELGYEQVHPQPGNRARDVCADLRGFLRAQTADPERPWFACAGFFDVHRPWCQRRDSRYNPDTLEVPAWLPDLPVVRQDLARFYQDIEPMDAALGTVLQTLAETGLDKETLVIFTTDHGAAFPGAKATLYDAGLRVPLILHWPGKIEGGIVHEHLISNLDLVPTLLELVAGQAADRLAGQSFLPLLHDDPAGYTPRDYVGGALFYDVAYDPMHYVRTPTHKYIRSFAVTAADAQGADPETLSTFTAGRWVRVDDFDVMTAPSWQAMAPSAGTATPEPEELYDLQADPTERHNLVDDPAAAPVLQAMRRHLDQLMQATDSPLLHGHVPPPPEQREAFRKHTPNSPAFAAAVAARKKLL